VHNSKDGSATQTGRKCASKSAAPKIKPSRGAEQTQNITDIFKNTIDISTNSIDISTNLNDILSLFGTFGKFEVRAAACQSADKVKTKGGTADSKGWNICAQEGFV